MIDETAEEIAEMRTHSSSVVAVKAAAALRTLTEETFPSVDEYQRTLERNSSALRRANPSHASLHTTQREIVDTVAEAKPETVQTAQEITAETIDRVIERVERAKAEAAARGASLIADADTILTHDYSTTVFAAIEQAVADESPLTVYVTEARPRYLGRKLARELAQLEPVETHLIVDSANGHFLTDCDRVVVGMDCIVDETLYNRVGTYPIAATAASEDVPVTVVGSESKIVTGGFAFENEHRSATEVMREPAEGFRVDNPAYDGTPVSMLESVITDERIREY